MKKFLGQVASIFKPDKRDEVIKRCPNLMAIFRMTNQTNCKFLLKLNFIQTKGFQIMKYFYLTKTQITENHF